MIIETKYTEEEKINLLRKTIKSEKVGVILVTADWSNAGTLQQHQISELKGSIPDNMHHQVYFYEINASLDEEREYIEKLGIKSIPSTLIFKNNEVKDELSGVVNSDLILQKVQDCL